MNGYAAILRVMFLVFLILFGSYVARSKMKDETKIPFFVVLCCVFVAYGLLSWIF